MYAQYAKGIEGQATLLVGGGLALYVNGSVNKATAADTGKQISGAPDMTAALGLIYNGGPWSASLIHKRTGATYQKDFAGARSVKLQVNVFNLLNNQKVTSISAASSSAIKSAGDQYLFQAPRSVQVSAKLSF